LRLRSLRDDPNSYRRVYSDEAEAPEGNWKSWVGELVKDPDQDVVVVEADGELAGLAMVHISQHVVLSIGGMWVAPDHRRRGAGRLLVEAALMWGRSRGAVRARLAVTIGNSAAEALYAAAGFVATGAREPLREHSSIQIMWMERNLEGGIA
jgi:GNAT superfamily N-acetyltransferase